MVEQKNHAIFFLNQKISGTGNNRIISRDTNRSKVVGIVVVRFGLRHYRDRKKQRNEENRVRQDHILNFLR